MTDWVDAAADVFDAAEDAAEQDGTDRLKAENAVVGDACELVKELSEAGRLSEADMNALAGELSETLAQYTKTDLKTEFREYFSDELGDGKKFNQILSDRVEEIQIVHSSDAKQGTVWRWHFDDGVMLETETSKDGGRLHHKWSDFKKDYFDALLAEGKGEQIAKPDQELRDPEAWQEWVDNLILQHGETVKHTGPRTEAVYLLRDYVERNIGYTDVSVVRQRQGIWTPEADDGQLAADGGVGELRIPSEDIKRICEQTGISTRALQIELNARGLTHPEVNGVSDATYDDGVRVPYWVLSDELAEPAEIVTDPETPAQQVQREEESRQEEQRSELGAVDGGHDDETDDQDSVDHNDPLLDDDEDDDYEPGEFDSIGFDDDDEGGDDE